MNALKRDTARDHHRVIDPAEAEVSENNHAQERGHRKAKARAKAKVGESTLKRLFQFKKSTVVRVLLAPSLRQCWLRLERRGHKAGDDRKEKV